MIGLGSDKKTSLSVTSIKSIKQQLVSELVSPGARACTLRALGLLLVDGALTVRGGRLFELSTGFFFTKTAVTQERKVEKSIPRWEMNRPSEDYKRAVDKIWGSKAKTDFRAENRVLGSKKHTLLAGHHVLDTTRQSCANKKVPRE